MKMICCFKKIFLLALAIAAALFAFVSVGAIETGAVSLMRGCVQTLAGFAVCGACVEIEEVM